MEFKEYSIEELCTIRRGASPRPIKDFIVGEGMPWVKIADATADHSRFINKTKEYIKAEGVPKSLVVEPGDLILSNSATPGLPKIMKIQACIHDGWLLLRDFKNLKKEYMYYLLIHERERLVAKSNGSVFNNLKTDIVKKHKVKIPPKEAQMQVVSFISAIDEATETNALIIKKSEELSKTLFKHWFINFEFPDAEGRPYKSSGGKMVESELGEIPEGWVVGKLKDIAEIVMGQSPKSDTYNVEGKGLPLINGASDFKNGDIAPQKYTTDPKKVSRVGDYVFGVRATIGNVTFVDGEYAIGRGAGVARVKQSYFTEYLYFLLQKAFVSFETTASGSVYLNVPRADINDYKVVIPPDFIMKQYSKNMKSLFQLKNEKRLEKKSLLELRDTLLPKLLAGEIELLKDDEVTVHEPV